MQKCNESFEQVKHWQFLFDVTCFFLLLTWKVWSLIDGAILGFLAWFPDNKGFMPRPSTMSFHNLFFPNKSSSFMQRQLEIFEQIKWPPKSHCKSDSEWPAGSLANRTHSLNHCCVLLRCVSVFLTAMQPVCVDGSETVALTHYRDKKNKQKKNSKHYTTKQQRFRGDWRPCPSQVTDGYFYWQRDGNYTKPLGWTLSVTLAAFYLERNTGDWY